MFMEAVDVALLSVEEALLEAFYGGQDKDELRFPAKRHGRFVYLGKVCRATIINQRLHGCTCCTCPHVVYFLQLLKSS